MKTNHSSLLKALALATIAHPLLSTDLFAAGDSLFTSTDPAALAISKAWLWIGFGAAMTILCMAALVVEKRVIYNDARAALSRKQNAALTELDADTFLALIGLKGSGNQSAVEAAAASRSVEFSVEYDDTGRPNVCSSAPEVMRSQAVNSVEQAVTGRSVEYTVEYSTSGPPLVHKVDSGRAVGRVAIDRGSSRRSRNSRGVAASPKRVEHSIERTMAQAT